MYFIHYFYVSVTDDAPKCPGAESPASSWSCAELSRRRVGGAELAAPNWSRRIGGAELSHSARRHLRSSNDRSCVVQRTYNTFGDRSFAVAGPRVWNSLPGHLRDEDITYSSFRRELKTYWFSCNWGAM